jgi:hypothetical protein
MNAKEKRDLKLSEIVLVTLGGVCLLVVVWLAWLRPGAESGLASSFADCVKAGNPVQTSYPEVCVTPEGQRFSNPEQSVQRVKIHEWHAGLQVADVTDAYYSFNGTANTATLSTIHLDNTLMEIAGCKSGLHPLTVVQIKPGDTNPATEAPWTEAQLQAAGAKVGGYYYVLSSPIETLCVPAENDEHVKEAQTIIAKLRIALSSIHQE